MAATLSIYEPTPPARAGGLPKRLTLDSLQGKVVGFIDNAKPNFNHLVEDLSGQLMARYGVASVLKHRKPGQVPVVESVLKEFAEKCDAVITGSGD